jgi:methylmalonyl-CoA/ethylmalonyl-CoA epimerase
MISRIDHVSIAVKDYEKAVHLFRDILGAIPGASAGDDNLKYFWQIFSLGDLSRIEILKPTGKGSFLDNFLQDKKEGGVHHITLQTPDIRKAIMKLEENGIAHFGLREYGDFWKEIFIHPRDAFGVLIQIAEFHPDDWIHDSLRFRNGEKWAVHKIANGCMIDIANPGGGKIRIELSRDEIRKLVGDLDQVQKP